jgi:hypothetical protein
MGKAAAAGEGSALAPSSKNATIGDIVAHPSTSIHPFIGLPFLQSFPSSFHHSSLFVALPRGPKPIGEKEINGKRGSGSVEELGTGPTAKLGQTQTVEECFFTVNQFWNDL